MNTKELFSRLTDDISYLIDEAQALVMVIDIVPVAEKRGGIESMLDMIYLIDHAQLTYYRPLTEQIFSLPKVKTEAADFRETVDFDAQNYESPVKVLQDLIHNRKAFAEYLQAAGGQCITKTGIINGQERSIADLLEEMVVFERQQLRQLAERVLSIDRSRQNQGKTRL